MLDLKKDFRKVIEKLIPQYKATETQKSIEELLSAILELDDTKVLHSPLSDIYYILNPTLAYYLRLTKYHITVSNHEFTFQEDVSEPFLNLLTAVLDQYLETEIRAVESEVQLNKLELLDRMKNRITIKYNVQNKA